MRLKENTYIIVDSEDQYRKVIRMNIGLRWRSGHLAHEHKLIIDGQYALIRHNGTLFYCRENQLENLRVAIPYLTNIKDQ